MIPRSIEELLEQHEWFITGSLRILGKGRLTDEDIEDLRQLVLLRIHAKGYLEKYDPRVGKFTTYLHTLIHNVACNFFEQQEGSHGHRRALAQALSLTTPMTRIDVLLDDSFTRVLETEDAARRLRDRCAAQSDQRGKICELLLAGYKPGDILAKVKIPRRRFHDEREQIRQVARELGLTPA